MNNSHSIREITISYQPDFDIFKEPKMNGSSCAYELFRKNYDDTLIGYQEHFKVMFLNRGNYVLGVSTISQGGISNVLVDPKIIFAMAIKSAASGIILAHNHPSGQLRPSQSDLSLTQKIKQGARLFDINLVDHLILSPEPNKYYSFADEHVL